MQGWSTETPDQYEIEGVLKMWSSEGGYAPSQIEIGGESLDALLQDKFGVKDDTGAAGIFHITIQRLQKEKP